MIRFGSYVLLLISIGIAFYMLGFQSPVFYMLGVSQNTTGSAMATNNETAYNGQPFEMTNFNQRIGQLLSSNSEISSMILSVAAVIGLSALTGFSAMYFVPIILLIFVTNFVIMPVSSDILNTTCAAAAAPANCLAQAGGLPVFIYYPILLLLNVMCVMAAISFIRGST